MGFSSVRGGPPMRGGSRGSKRGGKTPGDNNVQGNVTINDIKSMETKIDRLINMIANIHIMVKSSQQASLNSRLMRRCEE